MLLARRDVEAWCWEECQGMVVPGIVISSKQSADEATPRILW